MIIVELVDSNTRERCYLDKQVKLLQKKTGNLYDNAVDVISCICTYEETDEPIISELKLTSESVVPEITIPPVIPTIPW